MVALKASSLQIDSTPGLLRYSRIFFANRVSSPHCYHGNTSSDFEQVRCSKRESSGWRLPHAPKRGGRSVGEAPTLELIRLFNVARLSYACLRSSPLRVFSHINFSYFYSYVKLFSVKKTCTIYPIIQLDDVSIFKLKTRRNDKFIFFRGYILRRKNEIINQRLEY